MDSMSLASVSVEGSSAFEARGASAGSANEETPSALASKGGERPSLLAPPRSHEPSSARIDAPEGGGAEQSPPTSQNTRKRGRGIPGPSAGRGSRSEADELDDGREPVRRACGRNSRHREARWPMELRPAALDSTTGKSERNIGESPGQVGERAPQVEFVSSPATRSVTPGEILRLEVPFMLHSIRTNPDFVHVEGGHLRLPEGIVWPNAQTRTLHVRPAYEALYNDILNKGRPQIGTKLHSIITGQTGIGKSVFGWYIIYKILTETPPRALVYVDAATPMAYLVDRDGNIWQTLSDHFDELICMARAQHCATLPPTHSPEDFKDAVTVIADSVLPKPKGTPHPVIVLSSPDRVRTAFDVNSTRLYAKYFMPLPSEDEVIDMAFVAFRGLSLHKLRARMQLWGPVPRLVLAESDPLEVREVVESIVRIPSDTLVRSLESLAQNPLDRQLVPHRLFVQCAAGQHLRPGEPAIPLSNRLYYAKGLRQVSSPALVRFVINKTKSHVNFMMKLLVDSSSRIAPLGVLRGITFEAIALRVLQDGGRFSRRPLTRHGTIEAGAASGAAQAADNEFVLRAHSSVAKFRNDTELRDVAKPRVMLIPQNTNHAGVDGFIWDSPRDCYACVQIAVNKDRTIHGAGLAATLRELGWVPHLGVPKQSERSPPSHAKLRLYWVVPEDDLMLQEWQTAHFVSDEDRSQLTGMEQFVIGLPSLITVETADRVATSQLPDFLDLVRETGDV